MAGSTDFSQIATKNPPTEKHKLAFDILVDRIVGFVGSYFVKLNGQVDAVVFAGGIGEQSPLLRKTVADKCRCLGISVDDSSNNSGVSERETTVVDISQNPGQKPAALICQTDEEVRNPPPVNYPPSNTALSIDEFPTDRVCLLNSLKWLTSVSITRLD